MYLSQLLLLTLLFIGITRTSVAPALANNSEISISPDASLFKELQLEGLLAYDVFAKAVNGVNIYHPEKQFLAIADFSKASTQKRLFIIDLIKRKLVLNTYVAHGKNSGALMATSFSNKPQSLMSSPGFYLVRDVIQSPKHGEALLLEGLEKGVNDNARKREIIIHGAEYVCEQFIQATGRLGRSFGCPAVPVNEMHQVSQYLAGGSLLYIFSPQHQ
jgi:hypothetical protein